MFRSPKSWPGPLQTSKIESLGTIVNSCYVGIVSIKDVGIIGYASEIFVTLFCYTIYIIMLSQFCARPSEALKYKFDGINNIKTRLVPVLARSKKKI